MGIHEPPALGLQACGMRDNELGFGVQGLGGFHSCTGAESCSENSINVSDLGLDFYGSKVWG